MNWKDKEIFELLELIDFFSEAFDRACSHDNSEITYE